ncbi:MAG: hypothetical protein WCJ19_05985 [bacterium]
MPDKDLESKLVDTIKHIHFECYKLCKRSFNKYFANAGNIGIFCHSDTEYQILTNIRKNITEPTDNADQKYFRLYNPIIIPADNDVPETIYSFLYIRKPDPTPYGEYLGDIDFYAEDAEFYNIKNYLLEGNYIDGAKIYDRPDLDMIQLYDEKCDSVAYLSKKSMTETVRVKQSEITKL